MISYELLGILCLAAFWVSVILVAADGWSEMRDIGGLLRRLSGARRGTIVSARGDDGGFASCVLEQRGHALDGEVPLVDVSHGLVSSVMQGGVVRFDGGEEAFDPDEDATVWLGADAFGAAAKAPEDFDGCVKRAASPRGYRREIHLDVRAGDDVWVAPGFVSTFPPRPFLSKQRRRWALYLFAHLALAAGVTAVVLSGPMDSFVVKLGGALCLAHFLGSPPVLRAVRAATRTPEAARRFWTWRAG